MQLSAHHPSPGLLLAHVGRTLGTLMLLGKVVGDLPQHLGSGVLLEIFVEGDAKNAAYRFRWVFPI